MNNQKMSQETIDLLWRGFLAIMIALTVMYLPMDAWAQFQTPGSAGNGTGKGSALDTAFCNVINWFNGPIGKGIATIAIVVVGVGALMGKVSWGMAIIVGLGVALIFGATTIVGALGGIGNDDCQQGALSGNQL
jgi:type IV secretory pathway VirB2 component (pilin)